MTQLDQVSLRDKKTNKKSSTKDYYKIVSVKPLEIS